MRTGDCVLQPPGIRHRVLACSDGFEVIEVACPAEHVTIVDHELSLPSALRLDRRFAGQRFHRHTASAAAFADAVGPFAVRDTGIGQASGGAIGVRVLTSAAGFAAAQLAPAASIRLWYVARGAVTFAGPTIGGPAIDGESACAGDLCVLPPATAFSMRAATPVEVLEFELPREFGDGDLR
jgi:mannose-6-phosphate isomerase-like protein (cupin superfamily)